MDKKQIPKISLTFATDLEQIKLADAIEIDLQTTAFEIEQVKAKIASRNRADYTAAIEPYLKNLQEKHAYISKMQEENNKEIYVTIPEQKYMGKGGEA